jgi:hypothetical protein
VTHFVKSLILASATLAWAVPNFRGQQVAAPELVQISIESVNREGFRVQYTALVREVVRSKTGLKPGARIQVRSYYSEPERGRTLSCGGGSPRLLDKAEVTYAYLAQTSGGQYGVAAGPLSFPQRLRE